MIKINEDCAITLGKDNKISEFINIPIMPPEIICAKDLQAVFSSHIYEDKEVYYLYRNVHTVFGVRYDITIINPGVIQSEYHKTHGHIHNESEKGIDGMTYPELYHVLQGEALFILQKVDINAKSVREVVLVIVKEGESIMIPPNYGHTVINQSTNVLVLCNLVSNECIPNYDSFSWTMGACVLVHSDGTVGWNPFYSKKCSIVQVKAISLDSFDFNLDVLLKPIYYQNNFKNYLFKLKEPYLSL